MMTRETARRLYQIFGLFDVQSRPCQAPWSQPLAPSLERQVPRRSRPPQPTLIPQHTHAEARGRHFTMLSPHHVLGSLLTPERFAHGKTNLLVSSAPRGERASTSVSTSSACGHVRCAPKRRRAPLLASLHDMAFSHPTRSYGHRSGADDDDCHIAFPA